MRPAVSCAVGLWLLPVLAVGVHAFGTPGWMSIAVSAAIVLPLALWAGRGLASTLRPLQETPLVLGLAALFAVASIIQVASISLFMADSRRVEYSYAAGDPWRVQHSCFTAYAEALRFARGGERLYDIARYEPRKIGPLKVDAFHYPPVFLLAPAALHAVRGEFLAMRALWFVMQSLVLAGAIFAASRWVGGRGGAWLAAGGTLALASPQVLFALQQGNVQSTAMPLGVLAMILFASRRLASGALTLAYITAAKIFPGILIVYLVAARRWRAVAVTAGCGVALTLLTLLAFGAAPVREFVVDEMPRLSSGAAFPQSEYATTPQANLSIYGMTVRARVLGLSALDQKRGLQIASIYGIVLIAFAAFAGWRTRFEFATEEARLQLVSFSLALLSLASFRSPFVGFYGYVATVWLMTVIAAAAPSTRGLLTGWALTAAFCWAQWQVPSAARVPSSTAVAMSGVLFIVAFAVAVAAVTRATRPAAAPAAANIGGSVAPA